MMAEKEKSFEKEKPSTRSILFGVAGGAIMGPFLERLGYSFNAASIALDNLAGCDPNSPFRFNLEQSAHLTRASDFIYENRKQICWAADLMEAGGEISKIAAKGFKYGRNPADIVGRGYDTALWLYSKRRLSQDSLRAYTLDDLVDARNPKRYFSSLFEDEYMPMLHALDETLCMTEEFTQVVGSELSRQIREAQENANFRRRKVPFGGYQAFENSQVYLPQLARTYRDMTLTDYVNFFDENIRSKIEDAKLTPSKL